LPTKQLTLSAKLNSIPQTQKYENKSQQIKARPIKLSLSLSLSAAQQSWTKIDLKAASFTPLG
jgi:hypothetical protein